MKDLEIMIMPKVMQKIKYWVDEAPGEVSGLGKVQVHDNVFLVTEAILLDQVNGAASTDIDAKAVGKAMYEMREVEGDLNFWWHSHVNMNVYFSGTDCETIEQIGQHGYCVASVFNKKGEIHSGYYQGATEYRPSFYVDDISCRAGELVWQDEQDAWKEELDKKCKKKIPSLPKTSSTLITGDYDWKSDRELHVPAKQWNHRRKEWETIQGLAPHEIKSNLIPEHLFDDYYDLFYDMNGIEPLSGAQLDEFYEEWKGSCGEASDSKYGGKKC